MKAGDLIRWNRDDYDESLSLPWFEKQGIMSYHGVIKIRTRRNTEYAFSADQLEVVIESR